MQTNVLIALKVRCHGKVLPLKALLSDSLIYHIYNENAYFQKI